MSENPLFDQIKDSLTTDPLIRRYAVPGACRVWSDLAIRFVRENFNDRNVGVEAREVVILDSLSHSFVQVEIDGEQFILDGSGVSSEPPYFGSRESSPPHFRNDYPDGLLNASQ